MNFAASAIFLQMRRRRSGLGTVVAIHLNPDIWHEEVTIYAYGGYALTLRLRQQFSHGDVVQFKLDEDGTMAGQAQKIEALDAAQTYTSASHSSLRATSELIEDSYHLRLMSARLRQEAQALRDVSRSSRYGG